MLQSFSRHNPITIIVLLLITLAGVFVFNTESAYADASATHPSIGTRYRCRPLEGPCDGNTRYPSPVYLTVGSGEFNNNISLTKVYSNGPTYTVNVIEAAICGQNFPALFDGYQAVQSPDIVNTTFSMNLFFLNRDRTSIISSDTVGVNCTNRNRSYTITLPASSFNPLTNRYEGYIRAQMVSSAFSATNENSFRYQFTGAVAGIAFDDSLGFSAITVSNRNIPPSHVHDLATEFAPTCNSPQTGSGVVRVYDVDFGKYQSTAAYPDLIWIAYSRPRVTSGTGGWAAFGFGRLEGGEGGIDTIPFTYNRDLEYRIEVRGLSRPNAFAIQISGVDLEDFPANYTCSTPPEIEFTLSCTAGTVSYGTRRVRDAQAGALTVTGHPSASGVTVAANTWTNFTGANFTSVQDGLQKSVTLTVTDSGGATDTATATYTCAIPPPVVTCVFVTPAQTLELGDNYYPVVRVINTNIAGAPSINASVNISVNLSPVQARNTPSSGPIAGGSSATFGAGISPIVTYPSTPATGVVVTNPGAFTVTANATWSSTAGGYSGTVNCTGSLGAGGNQATAVLRPYFKVLGGDIISYGTAVRGYNQQGVTFDPITSCATAIRCGAGVETAVQAQGTIGGVPSRYKQATGGAGQKTVTYANTQGGIYATWGGGFGSSTPTVNYNIPVGIPNFPAFASIGSGTEQEYTTISPNLPGGTVNPGARITIYNSGNLHIMSNITYANSGGYADSNAIPHLRIVATGNIYIDPSVSQLDGEFISLGQVYTCHNGVWTVPIATNIFNQCNNSTLIVNGALIGDSIKLTRMVGTLRAAQTTDGNTSGCLAPTALSRGYCNTTNIGEIIQFTPELFVARPASSPTNESLTGKYNSVTSLPPLF